VRRRAIREVFSGEMLGFRMAKERSVIGCFSNGRYDMAQIFSTLRWSHLPTAATPAFQDERGQLRG